MFQRPKKWLLAALTATSACIPFTPSAAFNRPPDPPREQVSRPNVVIVLLDDVGFGDTSAFGGLVETPNLDRLARLGIRYNNFHTTGVCSPTRAALLTGRESHRIGFGSVGQFPYPGYDFIWKPEAASIAQILRLNGYATAAFGKWHNTPKGESTAAGPFTRWPTNLGFDYFYGFLDAYTDQWRPSALFQNTSNVRLPENPTYQLTTDLTDHAIRWIAEEASSTPEKPYLLYYAAPGAHFPHQVTKNWIDKYKGRFSQGYDQLRLEVIRRQKELGVVPSSTQLAPRPKQIPEWNDLSRQEKEVLNRQMEAYAGYLSYTDSEIGRLIDAIYGSKGGENTIIFFIVGDNGPSGQGNVFGTVGFKNFGQENYPISDQLEQIDKLGSAGLLNHYASGWAMLGATPFPWAKPIASHLGAIRNPLIIVPPGGNQANPKVRSQFGHVVDIAPTIYDYLDVRVPKTVGHARQLSMDGRSLVPTFVDADANLGRRIQYFEDTGNRAIYADGWLASSRQSLPWKEAPSALQHSWELYNLTNDFSQSNDIAARYPAKLRYMISLFKKEARRNKGCPYIQGRSAFRDKCP